VGGYDATTEKGISKKLLKKIIEERGLERKIALFSAAGSTLSTDINNSSGKQRGTTVQGELPLSCFNTHPGTTALDAGMETVDAPATKGITNDSSDSTSFGSALGEEISQPFAANKLAPTAHLSLATIENKL